MTATFADLPAIELAEDASAWEWIHTYHDASVAEGLDPARKEAVELALRSGSRRSFSTIKNQGRIGRFVFTKATPKDAEKLQEVSPAVVITLLPHMNPHQASNAVRTGTTTETAAKALVALNNGEIGANLDWPAEMVKALDTINEALAAYRDGEWDTEPPALWWALTASTSHDLAEWVSEHIGDMLEAEVRL